MPDEHRKITIRPISAEETRPLRQAVLRPHQRLEEVAFRPGDDDPATRHFGAFSGAALVGIASVFVEMPAGRHVPPGAADGVASGTAWRLRGMAVSPEQRSSGIGGKLLAACLDYVTRQGGRYFWCNARIRAVPFYERHGLNRRGDVFDLPLIGPHFFMDKHLTA